jgi:hypothetical protein
MCVLCVGGETYRRYKAHVLSDPTTTLPCGIGFVGREEAGIDGTSLKHTAKQL